MSEHKIKNNPKEDGANSEKPSSNSSVGTIEQKNKSKKSVTYAREKVFIKNIWGRLQKRRWIIFSFFMFMYFALPFLRIDGRPALFFDIPARKFYIFFVTLWPQHVYLLTLSLITGAVGLFFSTALIGRMWCGYLCPQTVFSSVFIEIERIIIGDKGKQIRLSKKPWYNKDKLILLGKRNLIWGIISLAIGFTFMSYFIPNNQLAVELYELKLSGWALFWFAFITGVSFFDFGFFREQFCFVPCPYGRFQGALQDPNSLVVTYDKELGEGDKIRDIEGNCIDCKLCVQVCPTGIDIRDGSQFECISCARCVDACEKVMTKIGKPPTLIRYASENEINGKPTKVIRPRVLIYSVILTVAVSSIMYKMLTLSGFEFDIERNRNLLYQEMPNNKISNMYMIKVLNMSNKESKYELKVEGIDAKVIMGANPVTVPSGESFSTRATLIADKSTLGNGISKFNFVLERVDEGNRKTIKEKSTFLKP